jgi:hypothetical protein
VAPAYIVPSQDLTAILASHVYILKAIIIFHDDDDKDAKRNLCVNEIWLEINSLNESIDRSMYKALRA